MFFKVPCGIFFLLTSNCNFIQQWPFGGLLTSFGIFCMMKIFCYSSSILATYWLLSAFLLDEDFSLVFYLHSAEGVDLDFVLVICCFFDNRELTFSFKQKFLCFHYLTCIHLLLFTMLNFLLYFSVFVASYKGAK